MVKFVFVDQSDSKLDPTAKHFSFGSFNSLGSLGGEKVMIINKIASALTVRVEVSKACQTKLIKKSAYFLDYTRTAHFILVKSFQVFPKISWNCLVRQTTNSFQAFSKILWNCRMTNLSDATLSMWMISKSDSVINLDWNFHL